MKKKRIRPPSTPIVTTTDGQFRKMTIEVKLELYEAVHECVERTGIKQKRLLNDAIAEKLESLRE